MLGSAVISHLIAIAVAAFVAGGAAWQVQAWRCDARLSAIEAAQATEMARVVSAYREKEKSLLAAKNEAEVKYAQQRKAASRSADGARLALNSLRAAVKPSAAGTATASAASARTDGGSTARAVVGECAEALVGLAAEADRLTVMVGGLQGYVSGVCRP